MQIAMDKEELKRIIKEAIKETIEEERMDSLLKSVPPVSKEEMEDITKMYGKPTEKKNTAYSEEIEV